MLCTFAFTKNFYIPAVIKEHSKLYLTPDSAGAGGGPFTSSLPGVITTSSSSIFSSSVGDASILQEWDLNHPSSAKTHPLPKDFGRVTKLKFWDDHTLSLLSEKGVVLLYDLRTSSPPENSTSFVSSKASSYSETVFSFDSLKPKHRIGIIDSYGGYESFDVRVTTPPVEGRRALLPLHGSRVVRDKFNIEFSEQGSMNEFLVCGIKEEQVHILVEGEGSGSFEVTPIFVHDGHTRTVTRALFHGTVERLVFSASVDSMLHAWQYNYDHN